MIDMKGMCTFCLQVADANLNNYYADESLDLINFNGCWFHFQNEEWSGSTSPSFLNKGRLTKIPPMCKGCILPVREVGKCHQEITKLEKKLEQLRKQLEEAVEVIQRNIAQARNKKFNDDTVKFLRTLISDKNVSINSDSEDSIDNPKPNKLLPEPSILHSTSTSMEELSLDTPNSEPEEEEDKEELVDTPKSEPEEEEEELEEKVKIEGGSDTSERDDDSDYEAIDTDSDESELEIEAPSPKRRKLLRAPNDPLVDRPKVKPKTFEIADVVKAIRSGSSIREFRGLIQYNGKPKKAERKKTDPRLLPPKLPRGGKPHSSFNCPICREKITLKTNYEHMRAHVGDFLFQCPGCTVAFPSRYSTTYAGKHYPKNKVSCKVAPPRKIVCEICEEDVTRGYPERHFDKHETLEKNFTCPLPTCDEAFTHKQTLEYHIRIHEARHQINEKSNERNGRSRTLNFPYRPCKFCGEKIRLSSSLMLEHMHKHVGDYAYECPSKKCGQVFLSRYSIGFWDGVHRQKCDLSLPPIHCDTCGLEISKGGCSRVKQLETHLKRHESREKNFDCPVTSCGERFTTKQSVELHLRTHELRVKQKKEMQTCTLCESASLRRIMAPTDMENHLRKAHQVNDIVKCKVPDCPFVFPNQEKLLQHKISYHMKVKVATCDLCDCNELFDVSTLKLHYLNEHQIGTRLECEYCNKVMTSADTLRNHIKNIHKNKSRYKCDVGECGRAFSSTWDLKSHNIIAHGAEPLKCQFCPATFNGRAQLLKHEKYEHLGLEKPTFPCPKCSMILRSTVSLKTHLQNVHRDPSAPDFKCPECDKMFKSERRRMEHVKNMHEQVQSLLRICDLCGKTLKGPDQLKVHMRIHTGERPYVCALCGMRFRQHASLFNHNKSHKRMGDKFVPKKTFDRTPK